MLLRTTALCLALGAPVFAQAAINALDLGNYEYEGMYSLPLGPASEASAVTWNWDSNSLFVVGDEGNALVEVSLTGAQLSVMLLSGFEDTEGLTYIGNGQFIVIEERIQSAYLVNYTPGGALQRSNASWVSVYPQNAGNSGLEGISYDRVSGNFVLVKENNPQAVYEASLTFATGAAGGTATVGQLFDPTGLGVSDLSDVQLLSGVVTPGFEDADNLLIFSQESSVLLEVDRAGSVLSMFSLADRTRNAEGVTIDADGTIYIVDEGPFLHVLKPLPVPLPATAWLMVSGLAGLAGVARRKKRVA